MVYYFAFASLSCPSKNPSALWLVFIGCYGLLNTLHYFTQNKEKIVMTIFHRLQGFLVTYFNCFTFLFTLAKFGIYPCDVTNSYITNRHLNLAYLGLAKS